VRPTIRSPQRAPHAPGPGWIHAFRAPEPAQANRGNPGKSRSFTRTAVVRAPSTEYRDDLGVTGTQPSCPSWTWTRDELLLGHAALALLVTRKGEHVMTAVIVALAVAYLAS
jgi:hypothetical protein